MEYSENIKVAWQGLTDHKFRSFLTMLGIIFGVASVIAMLSIGEGAKREAIAKYQDLGVNNIIVREKDMTDEELEEVRTKFSPGLSLHDAEVIREIVPGVSRIAAQAEINAEVKYTNRSVKSSVIGVTPEFYDILNMVSVREHIHRLHAYDAIHSAHKCKVACLGCRVATYIYNALWCCVENNVDNWLIYACAWWIEDNYIRATVSCNELIIKHLLHITCVENGVVYAVDFRVYLCILNSLRNILNTHDLLTLTSAEVCNSAGTCVEVVENIILLKFCCLAGNLVELVCLLRVGLVE